MKIGIFGGSFNPPHNMHKNIALDLVNYGYLDKVIYVPTGDKYNKKGLVGEVDRFNMLKLMISDYKYLEVSDYEFKSNLTYTYQTLKYFSELYSNDIIYFILGSDNLKEIVTWMEYRYILDNFKILVIGRNNDDLDSIIEELNTNNIIVADIELSDISSTKIRNDLINGIDNKDIDSKVLKYIKNNKLYGR